MNYTNLTELADLEILLNLAKFCKLQDWVAVTQRYVTIMHASGYTQIGVKVTDTLLIIDKHGPRLMFTFDCWDDIAGELLEGNKAYVKVARDTKGRRLVGEY